LNPLGFKIVDFRPEPEVLTDPAPATAAATLAAEGMNVKALTSALLVAVIARSFAETIPSPGPSDSRIRVAPYSQDAVYRPLRFRGL